MKIRKIYGAAALTVGLAALASCGGTNVQTSADPYADYVVPSLESVEPSGETKTITFLTTAGDDLIKVLESAKAKFEEENPNFVVDIQSGYGYDSLRNKIQSDIIAKNQPSIAYCYGDHVAGYKTANVVLDLEPYIRDSVVGINKEEYLYMDEGYKFGNSKQCFTLPMSKSTDALYYNKTVVDPVLEELGIDLTKTSSWTWENMWKLCRKLKEKYPKSTPLGYDSEANWFISYLEEKGTIDGKKYYTDANGVGEEKILFNNDVSKAFLTDVSARYDEGLVTTKGAYGSYTSGLFGKYVSTTPAADYDGSFMSIGSTGGASHQLPTTAGAFEVGLAKLPSIDGTENGVKHISQGPSLVLFDQGDKELAMGTWLFAKTLISKEVQSAYAAKSGGYSPVRLDAIQAVEDSLDLTKPAGKLNKACLDILTSIKSNLFVSDLFDGSAVSRVQIGSAMISLLKNESAATIENKIASVLNDAYDESVSAL